MKKRFLMLLSLIFVATMCVGLVSCGDDDEENSNNPLIGAWVQTETQDDYSWQATYWEERFVFNSDNTGFMSDKGVFSDESKNYEDKVEFTYKIIAYVPDTKIGIVEIIWKTGGVNDYDFSIHGNKLVLGDRGTYIKQ